MNIAVLSGLIILVLLVIMLIAVALGVSSVCAILHQCYSSCSRNVYGYDTSLPDFYTNFPSGMYYAWNEYDSLWYYDDL